jgi:LEA14-like dessication related protein
MRIFTFLALFLTLVGCGTNVANSPYAALIPTTPEVSLKGFELTKLGLSEQTYHLKFYVKNPNAFPLPIQSFNYQLFINRKSFATGTSSTASMIPALGEGYVETDVKSNIADVVAGWQQWLTLASKTVDYRITGDVGISSYNLPLPFQYADKIELLIKK